MTDTEGATTQTDRGGRSAAVRPATATTDPGATARAHRAARAIAPETLAETLDRVVERLSEAGAGSDDAALRESIAAARRVAAGLRELAPLFDEQREAALARREEELQSIAVLLGQTVQDLARSNQALADEVGAQGEQLDELAGLDPEDGRLAERLRTVAEALHRTTSQVGRDLDRVATSVQGSNERIEALERELEEALRQTRYDALTQVHSRAALDERLAQQMDRDHGAWCLLIADLDHFKAVNDSFGHLIGDALLYKIAQMLQACADDYPADAFVGRYGGEEFGVILPGATLEQARGMAERMRREAEETRYRLRARADAIVNATVSIGVAQRRRGDTVAALIERADAALYEAKRQGRNRVVLAHADLAARATSRAGPTSPRQADSEGG